ncbi:MAG: MFS transporter [Frankiales bacterium]|nr:MFS transporter [Frankiales bacterium]
MRLDNEVAARVAVAQATRRYVGLTALRWLPVGLTVSVSVLLALSRGLSLTQIGLVFVVHSLLVVLLELPTGGLADAIGRRPVLVASGVLHLLACLAYATADDVSGFVLAAGLQATGRALDSGPLQAWYVDTVRRADPGADIVPGLSRAGTADCLALAAGAVVGGLAPTLLSGAASSALLLPYLVAAVLDVVSIVAVLVLVTPTGARPNPRPSTSAALRAGLTAVPHTVRDSVALCVRDQALRRVMLLSLAGGFVLLTLELLGPPLFADLAGGTTSGSSVYGVVMAVSFLAGAAGAALAPGSRRLARQSTPWAVTGLTAAGALAVAGVAATTTVLAAAVAYAAFYLLNAARWPLVTAVLHSRVGAGQRATALSASSLSLQLGGAISAVVSPAVREISGGPDAAFLLTGAVALGAAALALGLDASGSGLDQRGPEVWALTATEPPTTAPESPAAPAAPPPAGPARPRRPG